MCSSRFVAKIGAAAFSFVVVRKGANIVDRRLTKSSGFSVQAMTRAFSPSVINGTHLYPLSCVSESVEKGREKEEREGISRLTRSVRVIAGSAGTFGGVVFACTGGWKVAWARHRSD